MICFVIIPYNLLSYKCPDFLQWKSFMVLNSNSFSYSLYRFEKVAIWTPGLVFGFVPLKGVIETPGQLEHSCRLPFSAVTLYEYRGCPFGFDFLIHKHVIVQRMATCSRWSEGTLFLLLGPVLLFTLRWLSFLSLQQTPLHVLVSIQTSEVLLTF